MLYFLELKLEKENKMSGNLILIRGLPGSGKSTLAKEIMDISFKDEQEIVHFEADMFHINEDGEYNFIQSRVSEAHDWCKTQTRLALEADKNVIVSNTFIKMWEMKYYFSLPSTSITVYETKGDYGSIHSVPDDVINRMKKNWEELGYIEGVNIHA